MVIEPFVRMGPLPRSLAAEANGCFMVRLPRGANRIQGRGAILRAPWRAPLGSFAIPGASLQPGQRAEAPPRHNGTPPKAVAGARAPCDSPFYFVT